MRQAVKEAATFGVAGGAVNLGCEELGIQVRARREGLRGRARRVEMLGKVRGACSSLMRSSEKNEIGGMGRRRGQKNGSIVIYEAMSFSL